MKDFRRWIILCEMAPLAVTTPDDINPNAKVVLPTVYRGVEGGTDAQRAIRIFRGGDLGDGVYVTARQWLAKTYGGGHKATVKNRGRVVHRYRIDALFPEDVVYFFGGATSREPVSLVTGNGIELWRGEWSGENVEKSLRGHGIKLVIGTPNSVGVNQIAIRDPRLLHPIDEFVTEAATTDSLAFRRWFGQSKVVNHAGGPLIVYHGTDREFEIFVPQAGERGDGGIFVDTVTSPFKFFSADANYAYGVADAKSADPSKRIVLRCYLRIERPIDLRTSAGLIAFNRLFHAFERHPRVQAIRDKIADLRTDIGIEQRRTPRASTYYDIYDATGQKVGSSTQKRDDTPYTYRERMVTVQQAAAWQAREIKAIERKIANMERSVDTAVGRMKQPRVAWDPLDAPDAAEKVQTAGFDGLIFEEISGELSFAIIEPTQVKSIRNRGGFDPTSPNIYETISSPARSV